MCDKRMKCKRLCRDVRVSCWYCKQRACQYSYCSTEPQKTRSPPEHAVIQTSHKSRSFWRETRHESTYFRVEDQEKNLVTSAIQFGYCRNAL